MRSFEGKVQSINDVARAVITDPGELRDWGLIQTHIRAMYALRNKIAHGALLESGSDAFVEPFFSVSSPTTQERLRVPDIDAMTIKFGEATHLLQWFLFRRINSRTPRPLFPEQEPDLIRDLRRKADLKREAQRHRDLAWRQYLDRNPELKFD